MWHSEYSRELWYMGLCLFGVQWVMPCRVVDLLAVWTGRCGKFSRGGNCWKAIPLCLMWIIWRERNNRAFEGIRTERRTLELKIILRSLF